MKNTLKTLLALAMVICMLFTVAGCGDKNKDTSSAASANDDMFKDEATLQAAPSSSETSTGNSTPGTSSESNGSQGGTVTTEVPNENLVGGKSFNDILKNMPKKLRGTKLTMYNWNPANEYTGAPKVMEDFKKKTGIQVTWNTINYGSYFTKLPALIAAGENIPDTARIGYADLNFIQNMQPLSVSKFDFTDEAWDQTMMKNLTFNGKTYGTTIKNTHISGVSVMFYNKAVVDKYDYEDPYKLWKAGKWTWDKYVDMCEDAKDDGMSFGSVGEGHMPAYVGSWGLTNIYYNAKTNKMASNWNTSNWLKVHQTLGKLYNEKSIFGKGREELFDAGGCLFYIGSTVHARNKNSYFGDLKANKTLYFVPIPEHEDLNGKYYQYYTEIEAYGIPKGAKNPEAVPYFLRFFLDGANYTLDTYFGNKQNLEVYNWCMNRENKVISWGYQASNVKGAGDKNSIDACTGAQMKNFIDSNKGANEKYLKEQNEILNKLK